MINAIKRWFHKHLGTCTLGGKARIESWMPIEHGYVQYCTNPLCDHVHRVRKLTPLEENALRVKLTRKRVVKPITTERVSAAEPSVVNTPKKSKKRRVATRK